MVWPSAARRRGRPRQSRSLRMGSPTRHADGVGGRRRGSVGAPCSFPQGEHNLDWNEGSKLHIEIRWTAVYDERFRKYARDLVVLGPAVIFATSNTAVAALLRAARAIPIFLAVSDPIGAGFVDSLA